MSRTACRDNSPHPLLEGTPTATRRSSSLQRVVMERDDLAVFRVAYVAFGRIPFSPRVEQRLHRVVRPPFPVSAVDERMLQFLQRLRRHRARPLRRERRRASQCHNHSIHFTWPPDPFSSALFLPHDPQDTVLEFHTPMLPCGEGRQQASIIVILNSSIT